MIHSIGLILLGVSMATNPTTWDSLAPGLELGHLRTQEGQTGGATVVVLRIDPRHWNLDFAGISQADGARSKTAREWCGQLGFAAAINAGMFETDYKTHVGYLRVGDHVNSGHVTGYKSVAAFGPNEGQPRPPFRIFDLDSPGVTVESIVRDYRLVAQNLRLIQRPGVGKWGPQEKRWSEAALGEDDRGRILFIFSRSPFSMHELNRILLASDLGLMAAQHLEGGPEAQLYVRAGDVDLELTGSFETGFREDDTNSAAWPVPNILGVRPR